MTDLQIIFVTLASAAYFFCGSILASVDIANREVPTPKDFYNDGYNKFGSWLLFILRIITAFPFYVIETLGLVIYKFIKWLLTVGRDDT